MLLRPVPRFLVAAAAGGLSLDFTGGSLPGGVSLTRASAATYVNSSGNVASAATDVARFDYNPTSHVSNGILIEPQRTNLALQSEDLSTTWNSSNSSVTTNAATAPDGNSTADKLVENTATSSHLRQQNIAVTSGAAYVYSIYAKAAGRTWLYFGVNDADERGNYVNLSTGALGNALGAGTGVTTVTDMGNGWYRCSVAFTAGQSTIGLYACLASGNGSVSYTGDGSSGAYFWGAQLEAGSYVSSYTPTTTVSVTRSADVCTFTIPGGITTLQYTFDGGTTQNVSVSSGSYTIPTTLNRQRIKTIVGS